MVTEHHDPLKIEDKINRIVSDKYAATFVNGMNNTLADASQIATTLNMSYEIPVTRCYNATSGYGAADLMQCILQTGYNVLLFLSPTQIEPASRQLYNQWNTIKTSGKDIVHFAHSQGGILTAATLWRFRCWHPYSFGYIPYLYQSDDNKYFNNQVHVVVFGTGYAFLDRTELPPTTILSIQNRILSPILRGCGFFTPLTGL